MKFILEIVFCASALAMLHTYIFYPALLLLLTSLKKTKDVDVFQSENEFPEITLICAAYNEEKVIEEKIHSTFNTKYPLPKITFLIGTDNCSDATVSIIKNLQQKYSELKLIEFTSRTGKIGILNALSKEAKSPVLLMTDANVYFKRETISELVKHFKNTGVGMVCGNISKRPLNAEAVTASELHYMNFENRLKSAESNLMGLVMGAEGGCYAIKKEILTEIPAHFIADDFFTTCLALRAKKKIIFENDALAYEDVATDTKGEFKRKARIATGNFQNLFYFKDLLFRFWSDIAFAFFSHKVLRWITPFLFLLNFITVILLFKTHVLFQIIFYAQVFLLLLPVLNKMLVSVGVKIKPCISLSHFMMMNAALLVGFLRYCKGVKSSVWEPVKR